MKGRFDNISKGDWDLGDENNQGAEVSINHENGGDLTISLDRQDRHSGKFIISRDEMLANTHLIIEAGNLAQKYNIEALPEVVEALRKAILSMSFLSNNRNAIFPVLESMEKALKSIEK